MFSAEKTTGATLTFHWILCKKNQTKIIFYQLSTMLKGQENVFHVMAIISYSLYNSERMKRQLLLLNLPLQ